MFNHRTVITLPQIINELSPREDGGTSYDQTYIWLPLCTIELYQLVYNACVPRSAAECLKITGVQHCPSLSLHAEISLNLLMRFCSIDGEIFLYIILTICKVMLNNVVLKLLCITLVTFS